MTSVEETGYFFFQSPWKNIFLWHFMEVEKEAFIATPTMDLDILRKIQSILIARSQKGLKLRLLVRFSEADFITKNLDPEVLRILALLLEEPKSKVEIKFLPNLSLTAIILDNAKAIMASGDLCSEQLMSDITYGQLMLDKEIIIDLQEDLKELWENSKKVKSSDITGYMETIKKRMDLRRCQKIPEGENGIEMELPEMTYLGTLLEPLGKDRQEPHLDETKKIIKELLIRARDAVDEEKTEAALFYIEEGLALDNENSDLLIEKGKILYGAKDHEKALACFDKVLDQNEDHMDAWAYRGMCHHELNDNEEALYAYDQATDIDPQYYPVWIKKGIILGKTKGREEDGLKCLEFALSQDPYNEEAWFNKAQILEQKLGRLDEAIISYRSLLRINPKHVVGSFRMGLISYKKRDDVAKAKKYFNRVVDADPTHIHAWMFKGEIEDRVEDDFQAAYDSLEMAREVNPDAHEVIHKEIDLLMRHKKRFKKAVELSDHLKELKPKDSIALYVCGLGALKLDNDPEKALEYMNTSIKADPKNKRTIISKANILAEYLDRSTDAVNLLKAAIRRNQEDSDLWMELGLIYFDFTYDPHEAIKCFDMVTKLDKDSSDGWYNKGMSLSRGFEKHQEGLKCLDQSTRLDDTNYLAWHEKGKILSEVYKMTEDALKCFEKALSIEPEDADVLTSMANLMRNMKDFRSAIDHYSKAINIDHTNINSHIYLAETYMSLQDHNSAQKALTSALQVEPKSERIWMMKAEVFRSQNELGKSLECYKRVLRFNPDNQDALNKKTSIEAQMERMGLQN